MKLKFLIILISLQVILSEEIQSQSSNFKWIKTLNGDVTNNIGYAITTDAAGNVYTTGYHCGSVDLDPGPATYDVTSVSVEDIFVTKFDSLGNFIWGRSMGGGFAEIGTSIAVDGNGNVIVAGRFQVNCDLDPDVNNTFILPGNGADDIFLVKLNSAGNFVWGIGIGDTGYESAGGIKVDNTGNIYFTGGFENTVDYDPGPGVFNLSATNGGAFVIKLDGAGNLVYAKNFGGSAFGQAISLDATGNIYTTGAFMGTGDFDPNACVLNLTSYSSSYDVYISKLNNSGNFVWAKNFGGADMDIPNSIGVDGLGNVFTTGTFSATVDFDPGASVANLTSAGDMDIFVSKLNSSGNYVWAKAIGGSTTEIARSLVVKSSGDIFLSGGFSGITDFDPNPSTFTLNSIGYEDIFVSGLNNSGNFLFAKRIGGSTATGESYGMCIDGLNNILTTGYYYGIVDFDPDAPTVNLNSGAAYDSFIHKMKPSYTSTSTSLEEKSVSSLSQMIYPNPCTDFITVKLNADQILCDLEIRDVFGKLITRIPAFNDLEKIDVHDLQKGIYFVDILKNSYSIQKTKIIKQ